jgi:hypothetical protein
VENKDEGLEEKQEEQTREIATTTINPSFLRISVPSSARLLLLLSKFQRICGHIYQLSIL